MRVVPLEENAAERVARHALDGMMAQRPREREMLRQVNVSRHGLMRLGNIRHIPRTGPRARPDKIALMTLKMNRAQ